MDQRFVLSSHSEPLDAAVGWVFSTIQLGWQHKEGTFIILGVTLGYNVAMCCGYEVVYEPIEL
jgi:hypothetical protein